VVSNNDRLYNAQSADAASAYALYREAHFGYHRFEVRQGDITSFDHTTERSELAGRDTWAFGADVWVSYAVKVSGVLPATWLIIGQMHDTIDSGEQARSEPPFSVRLDGGKLKIITCSDPTDPSTGTETAVTRYADSVAFPLSTWTRFVFQLQFNKTTDGTIRGWRDGVEFIPSASIPMGFNDAVGPYWKYGNYRSGPTNGVGVVEYANVEVGTASLLARVSSPLALPS